MSGRLIMLRIEVDGHFHGSPEVPKPWVARITGTDPKYGLAREFVQKLNDWENAHRACSGNLYGVVATFPLRDGNLYEVARLRGNSSRRHMAREFLNAQDGKPVRLTPLEALARIEGHDDEVTVHQIPDGDGARVAEVVGVGTGPVSGWVLVDGVRRYRLRHGRLYEVVSAGVQRLVLAGPTAQVLSQKGALEWLAARV